MKALIVAAVAIHYCDLEIELRNVFLDFGV